MSQINLNGNKIGSDEKAPTTKGLKSVNITFAISKATQVPILNRGTFPADVLSSPSDYLQIMATPTIGFSVPNLPATGWSNKNPDDLGDLSPKFTENGKFVTYT